MTIQLSTIKKSLWKTGLLLFLIGLSEYCLADYKDALKRVTRFDLLPKFQEQIAIKQISSYDTTGGNDDGFSGKYSYLRKENGQLIIADLQGTGTIQRIWTPTPTNDTIQFFFDGEKTARIELKFIDLFSGKVFPFVRPVVGNEVGGYYCYLPIPFRNSCKIAFKGSRMQFIQIQYREQKAGSLDASFPKVFSSEEQNALQEATEVWKSGGAMFSQLGSLGKNVIKSLEKDILIKPGETLPLFNLDRGGRIIRIEITPKAKLNDQFKDLLVKARWDQETTEAINSPLTDFFGYAYGKPAMQSLLIGVKEGLHYCNIPMPFEERAQLELEYVRHSTNQSQELPISIKVYYSEEKKRPDEGKFYAEWKREKNVANGKPYNILDKVGRGHYIGTALQAQGLQSGMTIFFEGDDVCMVDGELRLHGTGSEDYFNGGWYALPDRWDQAFSLPLHGCLAYSIPLARTGGYRLFVDDKISFNESFHLTIEHGPEGNMIPVDYTSVAYYYCDRPPLNQSVLPTGLFEKIEPPQTLEYWIQLLPVRALSHNATLSNIDCKDDQSGKNYQVYQLKAPQGGFAKYELEVPSPGRYKLYLSYLKGAEGGFFNVFQRQIPVSESLDGYSEKNTFVEKAYIGTISIEEGTNTLTIEIGQGPKEIKINTFLLHRIYLERINP